MEQIENRMVVDSEWVDLEVFKTPEEVLSEKGYHNIITYEFVPEDEAFDHALHESLFGDMEIQKEFKEMLVEWFYSGNWRKEE